MRRWIYGQIYKYHFSIEREGKLFWQRPWWHGYIERDAYAQDYSNYIWSFDCGWLDWSIESHWQKSLWGWEQTEIGQPTPLIRIWIDEL